jgi:regulator of replication initiation timing
MGAWTIDDLYDICCTMKRVIEENDSLKRRNERLQTELNEYYERDRIAVENANKQIGLTFKAIIDSVTDK